MPTGHRPQKTAEHQLIYGCDAEHQSLQEGTVNRAPAWAHEQVCSVCRSKKGWERLQQKNQDDQVANQGGLWRKDKQKLDFR